VGEFHSWARDSHVLKMDSLNAMAYRLRCSVNILARQCPIEVARTEQGFALDQRAAAGGNSNRLTADQLA
jgi:hypothetical protein